MKTTEDPVVDDDEDTQGVCRVMVSNGEACSSLTNGGFKWKPFITGGSAKMGGGCPKRRHLLATPKHNRWAVWDAVDDKQCWGSPSVCPAEECPWFVKPIPVRESAEDCNEKSPDRSPICQGNVAYDDENFIYLCYTKEGCEGRPGTNVGASTNGVAEIKAINKIGLVRQNNGWEVPPSSMPHAQWASHRPENHNVGNLNYDKDSGGKVWLWELRDGV